MPELSTKFAITEETVDKVVHKLTLAGYEGMLASEVRRLQPDVSAGNLIAEVTKRGYKVKCLDFGFDMTYILMGKYEENIDEE